MALSIIEELAPTQGLSLNCSKSLLFIPKEDSLPHNPLPPEIPITGEGFVLLDSPIGPASFCPKENYKTLTHSLLLTRPTGLTNGNNNSEVLSAFPKISFSLRTCPPSYIREATDSFNTLIFESLSDLVGGPPTRLVLDQSLSPHLFRWAQHS